MKEHPGRRSACGRGVAPSLSVGRCECANAAGPLLPEGHPGRKRRADADQASFQAPGGGPVRSE